MTFKLTNGQGARAENPNICPHCHIANEPTPLSHIHDLKADCFLSLWRCNFSGCKKNYAVRHVLGNGQYVIGRYLDGLPKGPDFPTPILNLKDGKQLDLENQTKFIVTYLQSLEAEAMGLNEIAGMGYRKAIEYLVKDWAIHLFPDRKDEILKMWLSGIINEFYSGDLKEILERATWLGNDQSHYNKLFEEYDLTHLKELIALIMVELDRDFKKKHYIETIEKRK